MYFNFKFYLLNYAYAVDPDIPYFILFLLFYQPSNLGGQTPYSGGSERRRPKIRECKAVAVLSGKLWKPLKLLGNRVHGGML